MSDLRNTPAALAGLLFIVAWIGTQPSLINVVTYDAVALSAPMRLSSFAVPAAAFLTLMLMGMLRRSRPDPGSGAGAEDATVDCVADSREVRRRWIALVPVTGLAVLAGWVVSGRAMGFLGSALLAVCAGWVPTAYASTRRTPRWWPWVDRFAPAILGVTMVSSTLWHAAEQFNLWQHFSLGFADIGFFIRELEYCLPWKDLPDRFADTRMGYHCIPLFYLLAPLYALIRSPVFLMVVGPLALNVAALPFYQLARHRGASPSAALLIGLAWLALPSLSRLPYANTYGFQSIYLAVPWLAFAWSFALRDRWRASHVCLAAAILCEETVCGAAFGWGLYLALFTARRRTGVVIASLSLGYLAISTLVVIPHFAESATYTRVRLFGDLTAQSVLPRLLRPRAGWYMMALVAPLALALGRSRAAPHFLVVAVPTLVLVLLIQNDDYLNIKYWHQASVLPALFLAAVVGLTSVTRGTEGSGDQGAEGSNRIVGSSRNGGSEAMGLLLTVLLFHQFLGFSPLAQAYRPYVTDAAMQAPEPRMEIVAWIRARYPRESTTVLATERMAAHFCDYRAVYPAAGVTSFADAGARRSLWMPEPPPDVIVLDRSDHWDALIRKDAADLFLKALAERGYVPVVQAGPVVVLSVGSSE